MEQHDPLVVRTGTPPVAMLQSKVLEEAFVKALPRFLKSQRWFGAKGRSLRAVRLVDVVSVCKELASLSLVFIDTEFSEGPGERYQLLVGMRRGSSTNVRGTIVRVDSLAGSLLLYDAAADAEAVKALLDALLENRELRGRYGSAATEQVRLVEPWLCERIRPVGVEQSNSSVIFDDRLLLKVFRKLEPGMNPDWELGRWLTEVQDCPHVPAMQAAQVYRSEAGETTLSVLQEFVPSLGDGWADALAQAGAFLDSGSDTVLEEYAGRIHGLGRVTAEVHAALADGRGDPDFEPESFTHDDFQHVIARVREQVGPTCDIVSAMEDAGIFRQALTVWCDQAQSLGPKELGRRIRVHGDYHLGQILRTESGWKLLDFEGEPARPLEARRAKQCPFKDVAGMLRSFSYSGYTALLERTAPGSGQWSQVFPRAAHWEQAVCQAFLKGYFDAMPAGLLPAGPDERLTLLRLFELEKALYEIRYELNHRPQWVRVPLLGLERMVKSLA